MSGNYEIRYAFPVSYGSDEEVVAILLVRDVRRDALEVGEIHERFIELVLREAQQQEL